MRSGRTLQPPAGSNILWKGKISPISQERLQFIEERLFILARTVQTARREGARTATRFMTDSPHDAHTITAQTIHDLNKERLALMMERQAIEEYLQENQRGS